MDRASRARLGVILVAPESPENVGFVARTMHCFGLDDLRLVDVAPIPPESPAYYTATSAHEVLKSASYYSSLLEALAPFQVALAFTRRPRIPDQLVQILPDFAPELRGPLNVALVFGRESKGLTRDECLLATHVVSIPTPHQTLSFNLSHAVALALSELHFHSALDGFSRQESQETPDPANPLFIRGREEYFDAFLEFMKGREFFYRDAGKSDAQVKRLRLLWQRLNPTAKELEFLVGLVKKVR